MAESPAAVASRLLAEPTTLKDSPVQKQPIPDSRAFEDLANKPLAMIKEEAGLNKPGSEKLERRVSNNWGTGLVESKDVQDEKAWDRKFRNRRIPLSELLKDKQFVDWLRDKKPERVGIEDTNTKDSEDPEASNKSPEKKRKAAEALGKTKYGFKNLKARAAAVALSLVLLGAGINWLDNQRKSASSSSDRSAQRSDERNSVDSGLVSSEIGRSGVRNIIDVDISGKGKESLNIRILTGNEPDIFNVQAPLIPENQAPQVGISSADVKRVIENPQADDETAKMIRSYLDDETLALVKNLGQRDISFPTPGPPNERLKESYASIKGRFDADWTELAKEDRFDMRSAEDLNKLELLKNDPAYEKAWKVIVADRLLYSLVYPYETEGYLSEGGKITDIIVRANRGIVPVRIANIRSLQTTRLKA